MDNELLSALLPVLTAVIGIVGVATKWFLTRAHETEVEGLRAERTRLDLQRAELEKCIDKVAGASSDGNATEVKVQRMSALAAAIRLRRFLDPNSELGGAAKIETTGWNWRFPWSFPITDAKAPRYDKTTAPFARDVACFISAVTKFTEREHWQRVAKLRAARGIEWAGEDEEPPTEPPTDNMDPSLHKILVDTLAYALPGTLNPPGCEFQLADLNLAYLGFPGSEWPVDLSRVDFYKADLSRASFQGAICNGTVFYQAICNKTVFTKTELSGANFTNAFCAEAKFKEATLKGADFKGAFLNKASFKSACLDNCSFENADICGCDFTDAKKIDHVKSWKGVKSDDMTKFPEGFQYPDALQDHLHRLSTMSRA